MVLKTHKKKTNYGLSTNQIIIDIYLCLAPFLIAQCLISCSHKIRYMSNQCYSTFAHKESFDIFSCILLMSSDHIFFMIEKILSTGADVPDKQNTNSTSF